MSDHQNTIPNEIPKGFCQCGCGQRTTIPNYSKKNRGVVAGQPNKFIIGHHSKHESPVHIYKCHTLPEHHKASGWGLVRDHILIAEKALGKPLPNGVVVHHVNGTKKGGPLVICQDLPYHNLLHRRMRALKACGHASWRKCRHCKQYDAPDNLTICDYHGNDKRSNFSIAYHLKCVNEHYHNKKLSLLG